MTTQFAVPTVGSHIRVTTRHRDSYIFATSPWRDTTYEGIVVASNKWMPATSFNLNVPTDARMPIHEINIDYVHELTYSDGTIANQTAVANDVKTIEVTGSKGEKYLVTKNGKQLTCTCAGFGWRKTCKHLKLI